MLVRVLDFNRYLSAIQKVRRSAALIAHLAGWLLVARLTHHPAWLLAAALLALLPLAASLKLKKNCLFLDCLAPLMIAYAAAGLRLGIAALARFGGVEGPLAVPQPWGSLLNLDLIAGLCSLWAMARQARSVARALGLQPAWQTLGPGPWLAGLAFAWAAYTYVGIAAHGVAVGDPYGYAQMGVDLARCGTPLHTFALAPPVARWDLPLYATVPVGYNVPDPATGRAATPWAPGHAAFLALGYGLAGERGLYLMTPLLGLAALGMMWILGREVLGRRYLATGLAVAVLATSYQQVYWLAVPMADVSAQLFSMLAVYFALKGARSNTRRLSYACLAGLALGAAFAMRYTQVLLAASILAVALAQCRARPWRELLLELGACGLCAWLAAWPVLAYHANAFGSPFATGSYELGHFALGNIPRASISVLNELLAYNEFLFLVPFLLLGSARAWSASRRAAVALFVWLAVITAFHVPYGRLRARDLLSVFPVLALLVGLGIDCALLQARRLSGRLSRRAGWVRRAALGLVVILAWARTHQTLALAGDPAFRTFGYLNAQERVAFDRLAQLTSPDAVIAASSNAGGIVLYAGRDVVRPPAWSDQEWLRFLALALADGREIYVLLDGADMDRSFQAAQSLYSLTLVSDLPLLYFSRDGLWESRDVDLYRLR